MRLAAGGGQRIARVAQQSGEDGIEAPGRVQSAVVELPQGDDQALRQAAQGGLIVIRLGAGRPP